MTPLPDFALRSHRVVTPEGVRDAAVLVRQGRIVDVVPPSEIPVGWPVEDVGTSVVMPGLVDTHVHINEPGRTEWEGFETATQAAAAGGITTLVDMPLNSTPVTTTVAALRDKQEAAAGKLWVDVGFYGGLVPGNTDDLEPLIDAGVLGVKAFLVHSGIDDFPAATEADLHAALPILARHGVPLLVHAELDQGAPPIADPRSYNAFLASRPRSWENAAIRLMIDLCRTYGAAVHIVHLSSSDAVSMLQVVRVEGLPLTVETCPHYLIFTAEEISDGDTRFKCAPPIRERTNRERLWQALRDGIIDCVVSDHSPSPPAMKYMDLGDFQRAWGGIASLQLGFAVLWTEARQRGFSLADLARWMAQEPARLVRLDGRKGAIAAGYDADLVIWNPEATFTVEPSMLRHRHPLTPYDGRQLYGVVQKTMLRGVTIYEDGQLINDPIGQRTLRP